MWIDCSNFACVFATALAVLGCRTDEAVLARMRQSVAAGRAAVIAKEGVIVAELDGRGVKPILDVLDKNPSVLEGANAFDKVVGRAAAAIYIVGKARSISAQIMSKDAKSLLERHGVSADADEIVPFIVNRTKTGMCPMDAATFNLQDPKMIVDELRAKISRGVFN